ncbi:hypothetical protein JB92DRAFT_3147628 [Gautieria morchelliformis]|nr:hypothetical protein JB92DRAFT_3147628 [Gautieria morchelliformis]
MHSGESLSGAHHTHHMPPPPQPQLSHPMSGQDNDNESIAFSGYRPVSKQLERGNEIHNDDANPPSSDDEIMSSPLKKKRKIHGGIGSLARGNTAPTSRRVVVRVMNVHTKFLPPTRARWRTFPPSLFINPLFPRFYEQFFISSFYYPEGRGASVLADKATKVAPTAQINWPLDPYDLYTPRFTQGIGKPKKGLCPICFESSRGGDTDRTEWLTMKCSNYNYHMQHTHGISPATRLPFSPPIEFRTIARPISEVCKREKSELMQGKCHECREWVTIESVQTREVKVKESFWWKHAAKCHKSSTIVGEGNVHCRDEVFHRLQRYERRTKRN